MAADLIARMRAGFSAENAMWARAMREHRVPFTDVWVPEQELISTRDGVVATYPLFCLSSVTGCFRSAAPPSRAGRNATKLSSALSAKVSNW